MPTILDEDLSEIFSDEDVSDIAVIAGIDVSGIFKSQYIEILDISTYAPVFTGASSDLSGVLIDEVITIKSQLFSVADIQPDGSGVTQLILSKN